MSETSNPESRRSAGRAVAVILLIVLILSGGAVGAVAYLNAAPRVPLGEPVALSIERGETLGAISERLENMGIIRSALVLQAVARIEGTSTRVQSGNYVINKVYSAREMHDYLLSGNQVLRRVTIPEGLTSSRVAEILEDTGITRADEFLTAVRDPELIGSFELPAETLEGYLFPDTYLFAEDYPANEIVRHMVERFFQVLEEVYPDYGERSAEDLHERVVLASIVEREYRVPEEAATIASVFYNRLETNMRLESCATVVYVMTEIEGLGHPQRLFYRDLERQNPYNTYRYSGLPPGPIANPGRTALQASFFPADTEYRFFVWNGPGSGRHAFTRTLEEHNSAARLLYLKSP